MKFHPLRLPGNKRAAFVSAKRRIQFHAQAVILHFLFQRDKGEVSVVIAYPEFFAFLHAVYLFAQRLIVQIVKIYASNRVTPIPTRMRIALHQGGQAPAQRMVIGRGNLIFQFVPVCSR